MQSHRTETAVKSVSSPPLLLMLLTISMAFAAPIIDLAEITLVSGTGFFVSNTDEVDHGCMKRARSRRVVAVPSSMRALDITFRR